MPSKITGWLGRKWQFICLAIVAIFATLLVASPVLAADTINVNMLGDDLEVCNKDRIALHPDWGCGPTREVGTVNISTPGYYSLKAMSSFDSGNTQLNESYYLTVKNHSGTLQHASDGNAGNDYVVEDWDNGNSSSVFSNDYAGTFYFDQGVNEIYINHYSLIAGSYPQFKNGAFQTNNESVSVASIVLTLIPPKTYNVQITKTANKSSVNVGDELTYTLNYSVTGNMVAPDVTITDTLPSEV
ncbi:DUF11 domain-containing protein, partial [Candidatus Kuenenbacteria bacterium]|nr:DUF11 domain-containing protein [Candidatus Kuenenbacteria bacterium]